MPDEHVHSDCVLCLQKRVAELDADRRLAISFFHRIISRDDSETEMQMMAEEALEALGVVRKGNGI